MLEPAICNMAQPSHFLQQSSSQQNCNMAAPGPQLCLLPTVSTQARRGKNTNRWIKKKLAQRLTIPVQCKSSALTIIKWELYHFISLSENSMWPWLWLVTWPVTRNLATTVQRMVRQLKCNVAVYMRSPKRTWDQPLSNLVVHLNISHPQISISHCPGVRHHLILKENDFHSFFFGGGMSLASRMHTGGSPTPLRI